MRQPVYGMILLALTAFSLATALQPAFERWDDGRSGSAEVMTIAFGESRKMFARHIYAKADAYFHSGYYPSIFDRKAESDRQGAATATGATGHACEFMGPPRDWLDRFGRQFAPSVHKHLGEGSEDASQCDADGGHEHCDHDHGGGGKVEEGEEREMLPWLKLAADLDPNQPQTYVVAAYWLRSHLGKVDEAEQFVRDGLRANPTNPELLFELGRIYAENRAQPDRARNVWELALDRWDRLEEDQRNAQVLLGAQLLGNLAKLEEEQKHPEKAIVHLERLKQVSPNRAHIQTWIDLLRNGAQQIE